MNQFNFVILLVFSNIPKELKIKLILEPFELKFIYYETKQHEQ